MAFNHTHGSTRRSGGRSIVWGAILLLGLVLSGCGLSAPLERMVLTPTLVPTLVIVIPPTATPAPSATLAPDTPTPLPTDTNTPEPTVTDTSPPTETATITPGPSPTVTRTPTITRIPTRTRVPSRTPTITPTPTITFTPTPPSPAIELVRPGLLSKVLSPIQMELYATTGGSAKVTIELVGEDGRVISRQVMDYERPNRHVWLAPSVPFEIDAAAETARLQISTMDEFGRYEALSSAELVLLAVGRNEINPPAITQESYLIRQPEPDAAISGGMLFISGLARPVNDSPLIIELITESGVAMTTKQIVVPPPTGALSHTPFSVEIPYKVDGPTPVRLTIRQEGSRIPGTVALASEKIILYP